jgi:hypothetical protein
MPVSFVLDKDSDSVAWYYDEDNPPLTNEQALVISVSRIAWSLSEIAAALQAIAEAIKPEAGHAAPPSPPRA